MDSNQQPRWQHFYFRPAIRCGERGTVRSLKPTIRHRTHFVPATRLALALMVIAGWSVDAQKAVA
jgi:hypothetical protein